MKTKKRLIDANGLSEQMAANFEQCVLDGVDSAECQIALDTISEAPTVDAVEVVRCKDCCHYRKATDWDGESYYACHKRAAVLIMQMNKDDFCSYGERKE